MRCHSIVACCAGEVTISISLSLSLSISLNLSLFLSFCSSLSLLPPPPPHRPWYVAAAVPEAKDVVIVIDQSGSMGITVDGTGRTRLDIVKEAVNAVLDTLYPTDRVRKHCLPHYVI